MQSVVTAGITGRGGVNLYAHSSYRTAGGCCVCSREMDMGVILLLFCGLNWPTSCPRAKKLCLSLRELEKQIGYDLDNKLDPNII